MYDYPGHILARERLGLLGYDQLTVSAGNVTYNKKA